MARLSNDVELVAKFAGVEGKTGPRVNRAIPRNLTKLATLV
jgi:hypothetical protein